MVTYLYYCVECKSQQKLAALEPRCPQCGAEVIWSITPSGYRPVERVITGRDPGDEQHDRVDGKGVRTIFLETFTDE